MSATPPHHHHRAARVYSRPRFGIKLTARVVLQAVLSAVSVGLALWWLYRHLHP